uniref:Suppressor of SWI4 1 homolog n=1 Tax=Apteryx owenii TaxID=8824 RepID=A0A8B9QHZ2_APTOW
MGRASKTKNQKKERAAALHNAQQEFGTVPHSFVFHRGCVGKNVRQLILDVRKVMEPYTARALKVRKKNSLKDFVAVAGPLGVTHFLVFSKSPSSINFYALIKDVVSSLKRHRMHEQQFTHHPLLVLSNFGLQQIHIKLMASMFQNMFPSINVHKVNLNNIKRCLLVSYDAETQLLDFRHYSVKVVPVGVSKGLKKLLQEKFPNMSRLEDISELLIKDINLSESEAEQDGTHNILELPQAYAGRGNMKAQQSAVRLTEIGPRMTLQLVKVEEGLAQGNVLYHSFVHKTEAEVQEILARKEAKLQLKAERRQKQEADVERKRQQREAHRKKSLAGIRRRQGQDGDSDAEDPGAPEQQDPAEQSDESDAEYYRQEVGEEPDEASKAAPCSPQMNASGSRCNNFSRFQEELWPVLVLQFPLALFGNAFAIYRFVVHERSWHSGIIYSFHLAVSGMLYSLSLPLLAAYYYPPKHWRYGPVLCKMERFLFNCNLYGSIFFVTCISLNRYLGIVYPLWVHGRLQLYHAKALSAAVWVLAGALSAPTLVFSELQGNAGNTECLGSASPEQLPRFYPYSLLLAVLGCGLPFLLTAFCYAAIIRTVFRNPHISRLEKRKVGLLVGAGVALYALSYLPYHVFRNINLGRRLPRPGPEDCAVSQAIHTAAQVCKILVNLNICVHPLLYAALADSMQSCCSAGPAKAEHPEHVELRRGA